ncbi:MAG: 50S ribosomal protein L17 [Candidatus Daviesbacteria bacterium]|nr:50S ribosomal protein L17 [Candidatus Daviesbacteria bacterium]
MRHRVYGKKLGLDKDERQALFKSLVRSLFISESIETTEAKAKAIKGLVDKLINQAKSPATRKLVSQFLSDKKISEKLVKDLTPRLSNRISGYTSMIKMGRRMGDNSMVVKMSLLLEKPKAEMKTQSVKIKEEKGIKKVSRLKPRTGQSVKKTK